MSENWYFDINFLNSTINSSGDSVNFRGKCHKSSKLPHKSLFEMGKKSIIKNIISSSMCFLNSHFSCYFKILNSTSLILDLMCSKVEVHVNKAFSIVGETSWVFNKMPFHWNYLFKWLGFYFCKTCLVESVRRRGDSSYCIMLSGSWWEEPWKQTLCLYCIHLCLDFLPPLPGCKHLEDRPLPVNPLPYPRGLQFLARRRAQ